MKKTSNAEYADDRLIDLRQLDHLQFDDVHEAYHLDWSSMLLLMRWLHDGEDSTIVIDRRGRLLNVERQYSELISELSQEYHVYRNTMATLNKKTNARSVGASRVGISWYRCTGLTRFMKNVGCAESRWF